MSERERRLEAAFDRYNRAALAGVEPTLTLFVDALGAEGLQLSLKVDDALTPSVLESLHRHGVERAKAATIATEVSGALEVTLRRLGVSDDAAAMLATQLRASGQPPGDKPVVARPRVPGSGPVADAMSRLPRPARFRPRGSAG